jgi:hypothetical protein
VAVLFNFVLPILAGLAILVMFIFIGRALSARSSASHQAYSVGRQDALKSSRVNLVRAVFALMFALIIIGAISISPSLSPILPVFTATPVVETPPPTTEVAASPTSTLVPATIEPSTATPFSTPTNTPLPTATSTLAPLTATVSSGVGVWLRAEPGVDTEQLEWLLDGTLVVVLDARQIIDDLDWQQVQTENGVSGWVAADFLVINEPQ